MKLTAAESKRFIKEPDITCAGYLVYGPDPLLVAYGRDSIVKAVLGACSGAAFERAPADQLARNPDMLTTMIKARGFFADRRLVCVDGAGDAAAEAASRALAAHGEDDGWLVLTAGQLRPASKLRKLFESRPNAAAAPVYDAALTPHEVRSELERAGLSRISVEALDDLAAIGRSVAPQIFAQTVERLALYKRGDDSPVRPADVEACIPRDEDVSLDELLEHVLDQRPARIGPALRQVYGRGQSPVSVLINAQREFRFIYSAASDPSGPAAGVARLRPPVFGPRRTRMIRHASRWGAPAAGLAVQHLLAADRQVRSAGQVPAHALVERALMRLSLMRIAA